MNISLTAECLNFQGTGVGVNVCTNFVPLQLEDVAFWEFEGLCFCSWFSWLGIDFIDTSSNAIVSVCRIDVCQSVTSALVVT